MTAPIEIILEGYVGADRVGDYLHVPFEMPEEIERLDVKYIYSDQIGSDPHLTGGNTVDIGIFDSRGIEFNTGGFRGWSGSARREFYIALDEATPGYMPGPIQPGVWHICLGLYKVQDAGCQYKVTIKLHPASGNVKQVEFPTRLALSSIEDERKQNATGWYRGEIHCHTYNSDGDSDPVDVVRYAEKLGLDFLAITDHNVLSQQIALNTVNTSLMLIPGMEVTTFHGHWNIWGDKGWIDFRIKSETDMRRSINEALERGYTVSCNHPRPYGPDWDYPDINTFHCIEVWNGPWRVFNHESLAFWERHLNAGRRYTAVGGSDSHFLKRDHIAHLGTPTNYIYCEGAPSPAKLLENLRAGHVFITDSPQGPQLYLWAGETIMGGTIEANTEAKILVSVRTVNAVDCTLQLVTADSTIAEINIQQTDWQETFHVEIEDIGYIRAQLIQQIDGDIQVRALTNPIYIGHRGN